MKNKSHRILTGILLIVTPILFMVAFTILQINFEYPDILRQPAIAVMEKFAAGGSSLIANWYLMVVSSILFIPISVMLHPYLAREDTPYMTVATTLGVTAGIVQMLGFIRWPFLVPTLASTYLDPSTSEATRAAIEVTFTAFNLYAGVGVGEHLGLVECFDCDCHAKVETLQRMAWLDGSDHCVWHPARCVGACWCAIRWLDQCYCLQPLGDLDCYSWGLFIGKRKAIMRNLVLGLTAFTALGIVVYWASVFAGIFKVTELVLGYKNWFMSFPLADGWIAVVSLLAFIFLLQNNEKAVLFGLLTGSCLIFLGLYALLYGINTGLIFNLNMDEIIEIGIKVYCFSVGSFFIMYFWNLAKEIINH
jgi:hypothetical protein